jgi:hypothetical protein
VESGLQFEVALVCALAWTPVRRAPLLLSTLIVHRAMTPMHRSRPSYKYLGAERLALNSAFPDPPVPLRV